MTSDTIIQFLSQFVIESAEVAGIEVFVDKGLADQIVCVMFDFSGTKVFVSVDGMDDSVVVSKLPPRDLLDDPEVRGTRPPLWVGLIGRPVLWIWAMLSTQGIVDGLQFEFGTLDTERVSIQLKTGASMLRVRSWSVPAPASTRSQ